MIGKLFYRIYKKLDYYSMTFYSWMISQNLNKHGKNTIIGLGTRLNAPKYVSIGNNVKIGRRCVIECWDHYHAGANFKMCPNLFIGNNSAIGDESHISCARKIIILNSATL